MSSRLGALLSRRFKKRHVLRSKKIKRKPRHRAHAVVKVEPPFHQPTPETTDALIRPSTMMQSAIEGFLLDQRSEHTRRAYGKDLKRFVKFLLLRREARGLEAIERGLIVAYKDHLLGEGLEHTTVDRHLATLRSFFGWLVEDGLLTDNPAGRVRFLKPRRVSPTQGFTDEEVQAVLNGPNLHTRVGAMHYAVLMCLFYCGLRRSELCDLKTKNIQIERGQAVIRLKGKGNAERILPLVAPVWKALRYYLFITGRSIRGDLPLFISPRGKIKNERSLNPSLIYYIVVRYARLAGIQKRVSPHSCRATAISNARDRDVPDRAIQEFAGWASPDMITKYDKRKTAIERSAAHAIEYGARERTPEWDRNLVKGTQDDKTETETINNGDSPGLPGFDRGMRGDRDRI